MKIIYYRFLIWDWTPLLRWSLRPSLNILYSLDNVIEVGFPLEPMIFPNVDSWPESQHQPCVSSSCRMGLKSNQNTICAIILAMGISCHSWLITGFDSQFLPQMSTLYIVLLWKQGNMKEPSWSVWVWTLCSVRTCVLPITINFWWTPKSTVKILYYSEDLQAITGVCNHN